MKQYKKKDFPVSRIREYLEPGPIVLVTSAYKDEMNVMTMGWYTLIEFTPSLIGCIISSADYSFDMIRKSGECVINIPTRDMAHQVVGIGNCSGTDTDKFARYNLTPAKASKVEAPLIKECHSSFECRIHDRKLINKYNFFIFEVVKAHVAVTPKYPKTIHFRGQGLFMVSGEHIRLKSGV